MDVAKERILDINPDASVEVYPVLFMPETEGIVDVSISYIVDSVDNVTAKIELVERAKRMQIPIISCMGTGNKLDPTKFEVSDIYKTSVCPLAKGHEEGAEKEKYSFVKSCVFEGRTY